MKEVSLSIVIALMMLTLVASIHSCASVNTSHLSANLPPHPLPPIISLHGVVASSLSKEDRSNLQTYLDQGVKITVMGNIEINGIVHYPLPNGATEGWLINGAFWCKELPKP